MPRQIKNSRSVSKDIKTTQTVKKQIQKESQKKRSNSEPKKRLIRKSSSYELKSNKKEQKKDKKIVNVNIKGGAAVDTYVPDSKYYTVYSKNGKIYSATLNQSNLDHNNNKFYMIQCLYQDGNQNQVWTWNRWGRVGVPGQNSLKGPFSPDGAIADFEKKYYDKCIKGSYQELQINYEECKMEEETKPNKSKKAKKQSQLHQSVKKFIDLIFDKETITSTMKSIGYDANKCPLGKLGENTIKQAYQALNEISKAIKQGKKSELNRLSSQFYTLIPHDFGFQKMSNFVIDTELKLQEKAEMLKSLTDLKITTNILSQAESEEVERVQQNYDSLNCKIRSVGKNEEAYKVIMDFVTDGGQSFDVVDIFEIERPGEKQRYSKNIKNDQLLWHGSRVGNFTGILSQGLRIAPPEAPHNGYAYGKGIYFANNFNTSNGYCSGPGKNRCIILCQAALGNIGYFQNHSNYLLPDFDSSIGFSQVFLPNNAYTNFDGMKVPTKSGRLASNANIVYNVNQARIRYVVRYNSKW